MKSTTLVYYGTDGDAAKVQTASIRAHGGHAGLRHAEAFTGDPEPCDRVVIRPDVAPFDRARIEAAYPGKCGALPPPPVTLAPPPPAGLPAEWRNLSAREMRQLAEKITGRTPEDRKQAIEMIEAAGGR